MSKDKPISTIFLIILLSIISFGIIKSKLDTETSLSLDKIPRMREIDSDNLVEIISYNSKYPLLFLISRNTCPSCVKAFPSITEVLNDLSMDYSLFYFDTGKNRDTINYEKAIEIFNVESVPTIVIVLGNKLLTKIDDLDILMDTGELKEVIKGVYP